MNVYRVTYWQEGPGRSDWQKTYVLSRSAKAAIRYVNQHHAVYKSDQLDTWAEKMTDDKRIRTYQLPDDWSR